MGDENEELPAAGGKWVVMFRMLLIPVMQLSNQRFLHVDYS